MSLWLEAKNTGHACIWGNYLHIWYTLKTDEMIVLYSTMPNRIQDVIRAKDGVTIVLLRSNYHVYICLFVNIEIKTLGWHIQLSGVFENYLISACVAQ